MNRRTLFLWSLYDFANSFVYINFLLYFSQWLIIDGSLPDYWYNILFAIATVVLLFTAPVFAAHVDRHGGHIPPLRITTYGTFIAYGGSALLAHFYPSSIILIAFLFLLGQYCYQLSFVFYNPLLNEIADGKHRARASGIGQFSNSLGQVLGLVVTLPLSDSRLLPLLPACLIFISLAWPLMYLYQEKRPRETVLHFSTIHAEGKQYLKRLVGFFTISTATPFLVAFFFFNDALVTVSNNYPIYMERVFAVPDTTKSLLLMGILIMSALGGILAGYIGDRVGHLKTLRYILIGWIILLPLIALAPNITVLSILTILVGSLIGSVWTVARAFLSDILPEEELTYGFSFYTLAERFSTFIGPLAWSGILFTLNPTPFAYRTALFAMTGFIIIGLLILSFWKRSTGTELEYSDSETLKAALRNRAQL
jgi:UMF1 family MFS transporter